MSFNSSSGVRFPFRASNPASRPSPTPRYLGTGIALDLLGVDARTCRRRMTTTGAGPSGRTAPAVMGIAMATVTGRLLGATITMIAPGTGHHHVDLLTTILLLLGAATMIRIAGTFLRILTPTLTVGHMSVRQGIIRLLATEDIPPGMATPVTMTVAATSDWTLLVFSRS